NRSTELRSVIRASQKRQRRTELKRKEGREAGKEGRKEGRKREEGRKERRGQCLLETKPLLALVLIEWTREVICSGCKSAQIQFPRAGLCHMHLPVTYLSFFPPHNLIKNQLHSKQASPRCKVREQSALLLTEGSIHKRPKETKPTDINHPGCQGEESIYFAVSLLHGIQTKPQNS
ncbi:hypothetical protein E2320_009529, partial [Naja naja]